MTDEMRRSAEPETPDAPDVIDVARPRADDGEELGRPDGGEFDGGRSGVPPEFPGPHDDSATPRRDPDIPAEPVDPGDTAVDDHVARPTTDPDRQDGEGLDRGVDRDNLAASNQGFRPGG